MQNWDDIRYFLAVCRTGSFLRASESLSVNASTVARRIEQLEEKVKCRLFDKNRNGMTPTPMGRKLLDQAYVMEQTAHSMDEILIENDETQKGLVSISITDGLGSVWLTPKLKSFHTSYPDISISIQMGLESVDLGQRQADIAIRLLEPTENELIRKKVGVIKFDSFASPDYLDRYGMPRDWSELDSHKIVDYEGYEKSKALKLWQEKVTHHDRVVLKTTSALSYVNALRSGIGLGMLPRFYRHAVSDLVPLELDTSLFEMPIYVVTHEQVQNVERIQSVKKHLMQLFEQDRKAWFS